MRVLILTCATGGGHLRAAAALEKYIRESTNHEVIQMDFLKSIGKVVDKTICDGYLFMAKRTPALFGRVYRSFNKNSMISNMLPKTTELLAMQLLPHILKVMPDVIISVHPFATEMISSLKENKMLSCPLICIMTDYGVHKAWIASRVDAYVVACEDMVEDMVAQGVSRDIVFPYGIPVHDQFFDKGDQEQLLAEMGLDSNVPTVLFMAGSMGVSNIVELYKRLSAAPLEMQMILITGNNKKMYEIFKKEIASSDKKTVLLQFTKEVERYMHAADLIVTKPGGLTVSEALACNLPLAVFDAIPGQEEDNANFLQTHDMGVRVTNENFSAVISSLIEHKDRLRAMRESCLAFDKSRANENILALSKKLAREYATYNPSLTFMTEKGRFNFRVAAVILQQDRLLVCKDEGAAYYYLPGGRVTMHETMENALSRELQEELMVNLEPERMLWLAQSSFTAPNTGERFHELCAYFLVDAAETDLAQRGGHFLSAKPGLSCYWLPLAELENEDIRPAFLKTGVLALPSAPEILTLEK